MSSNNQQLMRVWNDFLGDVEWNHAATLTTRVPYSVAAFQREITNRFIRVLAKAAQHRVGWFYAIGDTGPGHPHAHVLLEGTAGISRSQCAAAWPAGMTRVDVFTGDRASRRCQALRYVLQHVTRFPNEYDIARRIRGL